MSIETARRNVYQRVYLRAATIAKEKNQETSSLKHYQSLPATVHGYVSTRKEKNSNHGSNGGRGRSGKDLISTAKLGGTQRAQESGRSVHNALVRRETLRALSKRPGERTSDDLEAVEDLLYKISFLDKIAFEKIAEMCKHLTYFKLGEGEDFHNEKCLQDGFTIVVSGKAKASTTDIKGQKHEVDIVQGDSIGGVEILQDSHPKPEKAVCTTPCEVLVLPQAIYKNILNWKENMKVTLRIQHLKNFPQFCDLADTKLQKLEKAMTLREVPPDTILFRQDSALEDVYFVIHGTLKTIRTIQLEAYNPSFEKQRTPTASTSTSSYPQSPDVPSIGSLPSSPGIQSYHMSPVKARILARLLDIRREQDPGSILRLKKKIANNFDIFSIAVKALKANRTKTDKLITPHVLKELKKSSAWEEKGWLYCEYSLANKFDTIGEHCLAKDFPSPVTGVSLTSTKMYVISKFDLLKCLSREDVEVLLSKSLYMSINDEGILRARDKDQRWRRKQCRILKQHLKKAAMKKHCDPIYIWKGSYRP